MASSADHTSNEGLLNIRHVDLVDLDKETIAAVLGEALRENYMESSVEWVTSYPNLSQPPFNLAAEGICGNTALLEFGDMSYLKSSLLEKHMYNFEEFLKIIDRDGSNSFIFGHGICLFNHKLRELVLNTSFLPATSEKPESKNRSLLTCIKKYRKKCVTEPLKLHDLKCTAQGTYFLCDGSKPDVPVLEVRAKGLRSSDASITKGDRFIKSMQEALEKEFGSKHFVALGGVYTVNSKNWKHKLIPNVWESLDKKFASRYYCQADRPDCETMITTFNSSTEYSSIKLGPPIKLYSSKSIHSLNHHSSSVHDFRILDSENVKYLGYFCPATKVYRIDESL